MRICRLRSTAGAGWKSICYARIRASSSKSMAVNISRTPVACRRDRRKDRLLQENGYLVLRYLAEDLAKELDSVLDGIRRALSARRNTAAVIPMAALRRRSGA